MTRYVARVLTDAGLATLRMDLLTVDEESVDMRIGHRRFDIGRHMDVREIMTRGQAVAGPGGAGMRPPATMPATLDALTRSLINVHPVIVRRLAEFARGSRHPFREIVDPALELLGGVVPDWPLLSEWNRRCLATGARFFVWHPERGDVPERTRLEALLHTIMMISAKEQGMSSATHGAEGRDAGSRRTGGRE